METERRPRDPRVAALLTAASAPAEAPLPGEADVLAEFRRRIPADRGVVRPLRSRLVAAAFFGALVTVGGGAAAATGTFSVGGHGHSDGHSTNLQTPDAEQTPDSSSGSDEGPRANPLHGQLTNGSDISQLARTTDATGVDKGQTICTAASHGKCHAGLGGPAASHPTPAAQPTRPPQATTPPHPAGTSVAKLRSDTQSTTGLSRR